MEKQSLKLRKLNFTIAKQAESFPTVGVAAVLVASVLIVGLVIYLKKRKR
jgi:hypothetical protein